MEQKLSDTLVKAIDRSNPMMQNLQLASRFNKLIEEGSGDLEDNHEVTITENGTVEITPAEGKDGMKKVTASVNVSGGSATAYAWGVKGGNTSYFPVDISPADETEISALKLLNIIAPSMQIQIGTAPSFYSYTRISDTSFKILPEEGGTSITYTRDPTKDFTLWE